MRTHPSLSELLQTLRVYRALLAEQYGIKSLKIFGSYARGQPGPQRDLELPVEFATVPTLLELVQIEEALSDLLGVKVALVPEESISPFIRPSVQPIEVSV